MPLIFVPTPLGNLRDVTLRALDVLRDCDLVVAEDSRVARKLLSALKLPGKAIWSYREQNAQRVTGGILERARTGVVAVVTDAGMPGISDPGADLVSAARLSEIAVEVLPGPSVVPAVALLSGFPISRFVFEGFPPRTRTARRGRFRAGASYGCVGIWYESPQRIVAALEDLAEVDPQARIFLLREYTKMHEQQLCGSPRQVADALAKPVRGEVAFAVLPSMQATPDRQRSPSELDPAIGAMLRERHSPSEIARTLSAGGYGARRSIYARAVELKRRISR